MAKGKKSGGGKSAGVYELDFDDYDDSKSDGYDGDMPKRGTYDGDLISFREHKSANGNDGFEWIFEISGGPYKGWRGWMYSNMESAKWKTQDIVLAIQGGKKQKIQLRPKPRGASDGGDSPTVKAAQPVRIMVRTEEYEGETRAKIRKVLAAQNGGKKSSSKGGKASASPVAAGKGKKGKGGGSSEEPPF